MSAPASLPPLPRLLFSVVRPLRIFFRTQAAGGVVLMVAAVAAMVWANSVWSPAYHRLTGATVALQLGGAAAAWPLHLWVNEALMTVFFLVAGMEIKREMVVGELRSWRQAALPLCAAAGGMAVPACLYLAFNVRGPGEAGWGVPMATDIAFALGGMSLLGRRVPSSLFVFLTALAIFDDLGAILVIALFYGHAPAPLPLLVASGLVAGLLLLARARVQRVWPYLVVGLLLWLAVLRSGVHATLAGVLLGLTLPARASRPPNDVIDDLQGVLDSLRAACGKGDGGGGEVAALERHLESVQTPLDRIERALHRPVAFGVVPLFALVNAGVTLSAESSALAFSAPALGAAVGLLVGKPVGVFGATWLAVRLGVAPRPTATSWRQVAATSVLAGIGFTMSLFVADLAFAEMPAVKEAVKLGVFVASLFCLAGGLVFLFLTTRTHHTEHEADAHDDILIYARLPRFADPYRVVTWHPAGPAVGQSLADLDVRSAFGVHVLGARPAEAPGRLQLVEPDRRLRPDDTLFLVGEPEAIERFTSSFAPGPS